MPFTLTWFWVDVVLDFESFIVAKFIAVEPQKHLTASVDVHAVEWIGSAISVRTIRRAFEAAYLEQKLSKQMQLSIISFQ